MSKRAEYGLVFYKVKDPIDNDVINVCKKEGIVNANNNLTFIQQLNDIETIGLISEIEHALNGEYYEQYFTSDGIENESIELIHPSVIIGENDLTISMMDMKLLLQEWLTFITN